MGVFISLLKKNLSRIVKVELGLGAEGWATYLNEGLFSLISYSCIIICA